MTLIHHTIPYTDTRIHRPMHTAQHLHSSKDYGRSQNFCCGEHSIV